MKMITPQQRARLQQVFVAAQQARQSGNLQQSENLLQEILKQMPEAWDVHSQLGILYATTGRSKDAVKHFRLIVKANPTHAASHANYASALAESGETQEAITEFKRALALAPNLVGARIALAACLRTSGRPDEAIQNYKLALDMDKKNHAAFNGIGLAYRDLGDLPRALEGLEHAVGNAPTNAEYRLNFGVTLRKHKLLDLAATQFYEAVRLKPEWVEAIVFLAEVLQQQHRYDEAKECLEHCLQLESQNPELLERLGYVYLEKGDTAHSVGTFKKVISVYPDRYMSRLGIGRSYLLDGHSTDAATVFEKLIDDFPDDISSFLFLSGSRKFKPEDPYIPKLQALVDTTGDDEASSIGLNFSLGKIFDDCKQWDAAFACYAKGNQLRNAEYQYNFQDEEDFFDKIISTFNREFVESHRNWSVDSKLPVIIVGMPRSGTSLTEQIISSHFDVIGAGEVSYWGRIPEEIAFTLKAQTPWPGLLAEMGANNAHDLAQNYIDLLRKIAGPQATSARITDKTPHNFVQLGLIATIFPHAQIIHCKRDAMDNCLSVFFQNFDGEHPYAYDLANLGHHYKQYERLMAHWHEVLPGRIMDISYEDTIADPEFWSRKLIEHVGLEWDDSCLVPHKLERTVKTASHWQVRQPIYKTSVQRWKHYEKYLGLLKDALGYQALT